MMGSRGGREHKLILAPEQKVEPYAMLSCNWWKTSI